MPRDFLVTSFALYPTNFYFLDKENCRVQGDSSGNTANITIPINADCGMRRRRIVSSSLQIYINCPKFSDKPKRHCVGNDDDIDVASEVEKII
jgi:hypothetical protein